jgi:hypothetical protein
MRIARHINYLRSSPSKAHPYAASSIDLLSLLSVACSPIVCYAIAYSGDAEEYLVEHLRESAGGASRRRETSEGAAELI